MLVVLDSIYVLLAWPVKNTEHLLVVLASHTVPTHISVKPMCFVNILDKLFSSFFTIV